MAYRSIYTKRLGKSVASLARPRKLLKCHVIFGDSKWSVVLEGRSRALRVFEIYEQAVDFAQNLASERTGEVVIHEEDGQIKERHSFDGKN